MFFLNQLKNWFRQKSKEYQSQNISFLPSKFVKRRILLIWKAIFLGVLEIIITTRQA